MKPLEVNLHLALEQITKVKEELWEVQLQEFRDSVPVSANQLIDWIHHSEPECVMDTLGDWLTMQGPFQSKMERSIARGEKFQSLLLQHRYWFAKYVASAQLDHPCGIFYVCGKRDDGSYRYLGFRYGFEGSQYMSGFPEVEGGYRVGDQE